MPIYLLYCYTFAKCACVEPTLSHLQEKGRLECHSCFSGVLTCDSSSKCTRF